MNIIIVIGNALLIFGILLFWDLVFKYTDYISLGANWIVNSFRRLANVFISKKG